MDTLSPAEVAALRLLLSNFLVSHTPEEQLAELNDDPRLVEALNDLWLRDQTP